MTCNFKLYKLKETYDVDTLPVKHDVHSPKHNQDQTKLSKHTKNSLKIARHHLKQAEFTATVIFIILLFIMLFVLLFNLLICLN